MGHYVRVSHTSPRDVGARCESEHRGDAFDVEAVCEGCGLVYEVDDLRVSAEEFVLDCPECGCAVYAAGLADLVEMIESCSACRAGGEECEFHRVFALGWDACAASMAWTVGAARRSELAGDLVDLAGIEGRG